MNFLRQYTQKSQSLISFIIVELLAIVCFGLGGSSVIFFVAGILLNILSLPFMLVNSNRKELEHFAIFILPLALLALLTSFGNLYRGSGLAFNNVCSFFSIISFLMIGYEARRIKDFNIETLLLVIGGGFALVTLVSMIITWFNYGLFYSLIYQDTPIYYYNGFLFDVTKESSWLLGFSISEVTTGYSGLYGLICSVYLLGLLFTNFKQNKRRFLIILAIGLIGLLSLLTVPNLTGLFLLVPIYSIGVAYKFAPRNDKTRKIADIILIVLAVVIIIGVTLILLNLFVPGFASFVKTNRVFRKALNTWMSGVNVIFKHMFESDYLFGVKSTLLNGSLIATNTYMFEAEVVKEGGIFAFILLLMFIVFTTLSIRMYSKKSKDNMFIKLMLISLIIAIFLYSSVSYESFPVVHSSGSYYPFFRTTPALVLLTLIGLAYYPFIKEIPLYIESEDFVKDVEIKKEQPKKKSDDDYNFDEEDDLDE